ncbi:hypothetical protein RIF29_09592 [Crotalaria pallida]|uniref:Uncharacterized protein n=1 Tax=Crotalaria pallida TaxID=3830 RepID=A0AAN9FS17_CROPI
MSMQRKPCPRKAPAGLLEISDRVYVFDSCLTLEYDWSKDRYKAYTDRTVGQFQENVPNASIMVCNFREEDTKIKTTNNFCKHNVTLMDYPGHYHGCPVPKMEVIYQFLKSCQHWLSCGEHNVLLMHCDRGGGWPVLAFMLAALLIFRKQSNGEEMVLDLVYKQAPRELLHLIMSMDPIPSQLRYLQYVSKWNVALDWPSLDRSLRLDCIILRYIPNFDGSGVCHPMFRIYGQDPAHADKSSKILYSMSKRAENVWAYKQGEYELIVVDINCHVRGDILIECTNLKGDMETEQMMFHAMFNTAFLRSNILMLNRDKIDVLWDAKDHFPKDFRAEILFSEMDAATAVPENGTSWFEEKEGLPVEAFSKAHEIFSNGDWMSPREDPALQQKPASDIFEDRLDTSSDQCVESDTFLHHTSPNMPLEKGNEANCLLPSNLKIQSGSLTKKTPDYMSRKEEKNIKVDATPGQFRCSDFTSFVHQTGPKMPPEKNKEANFNMSHNLEVCSVSPTKTSPENDRSRKQDKTIKVDATGPQPSSSDSTTFSHQKGPTVSQEKKKQANCILPSNFEVQSMSSIKETEDNDMSRRNDKAFKVDSSPPLPSCSDTTTFLHQTGPKVPQEKNKGPNCDLPQNLEVHTMSSTKKTPDNDMSRKHDKTKVDTTQPRPTSSDSTTFLNQKGPTMSQEKKKERNCILPSTLKVQSLSSTKQTSNNNKSGKEDKTVKVDTTPTQPSSSDSTTSLHQTGSKMPQEEKKETNCVFSSNLKSNSTASVKKTADNDISRKQYKTIKVDAIPPRSSCSGSTTFSHQEGPTKPQEKKKEANSILPSNLDVQSVSSTKQTSDDDMKRKEDKTVEVDATPPGLRCSDNISQEMPSSFERTLESVDCVTDSKNFYSKQHSSDLSLPGSVDTSSSGPSSPQTPPLRHPVTRSAEEVHDYPPRKESVSPTKSGNPVSDKTKCHSKDRSQSFSFSSTTGTASSCTNQNNSQVHSGSNLSASAITSTQPPPPHSPLSSPTSQKKILPVRTRSDSSESLKPQSPHTPPLKDHEPIRARHPSSPPTPPPKDEAYANARPSLSPPPPPPPPCLYMEARSPTIAPPPPPPPPATVVLSSNHPNSSLQKSLHVPAAPAAPPPPTKGGQKSDNGFPTSLSVGADGNNVSGTEGRQSGPNGLTLSHIMSSKNNNKKLKPLHWMKLSRAVKGSLWDETQESGEASKAPEIDISELENLFSAPVPSKGPAKLSKTQSSVGPKSDKVQLIDHTRAYNCEILLSKVKVPLQDLMSSVLALEESVLDTDLIENLMKFCPTKEEIEVLKGYTGEKEKLGRCEQVSDLRHNLHVVNAASEEA